MLGYVTAWYVAWRQWYQTKTSQLFFVNSVINIGYKVTSWPVVMQEEFDIQKNGCCKLNYIHLSIRVLEACYYALFLIYNQVIIWSFYLHNHTLPSGTLWSTAKENCKYVKKNLINHNLKQTSYDFKKSILFTMLLNIQLFLLFTKYAQCQVTDQRLFSLNFYYALL